ncbi:MAG: Very short patch repair protein [Candidatus Celerinatantimonas neptuna]|nr:MAG: Very short patch repair protein [Candidatus Celerinatantimonas neptuna]
MYQIVMVDVHNKAGRHRNMAAIHAKNTRPERCVRRILLSLGIRYRINYKKLPGSPDIVCTSKKAAIFVNGCFWHGHECHLFKWPSTRPEFWKNKIEKNKIRDQLQYARIEKLGWRYLIIWECSLKGKFRLSPDDLSLRLEEWLFMADYSGVIDIYGLSQI